MHNQQGRIFKPMDYLNEYHSPTNNQLVLHIRNYFDIWMNQAFNIIPESQFCLEIGCGPTIILSAYATRKFNLECFSLIRDWIEGGQMDSFWNQRLEKIGQYQQIEISNIKNRIKESIVCCIKCDMNQQNIIELPYIQKMDVITSSLCLQTVATSKNQYIQMIKNIKKHIKDKGYLFMVGVLQETFYIVNGQKLPCLGLTKDIISNAIEQSNLKIIKYNEYRPQMPPTLRSDFKGIFSILAQNNQTI